MGKRDLTCPQNCRRNWIELTRSHPIFLEVINVEIKHCMFVIWVNVQNIEIDTGCRQKTMLQLSNLSEVLHFTILT